MLFACWIACWLTRWIFVGQMLFFLRGFVLAHCESQSGYSRPTNNTTGKQASYAVDSIRTFTTLI